MGTQNKKADLLSQSEDGDLSNNDGLSNNSNKTKTLEEDSASIEVLPGFNSHWEKSDPRSVPLLSATSRIKQEQSYGAIGRKSPGQQNAQPNDEIKLSSHIDAVTAKMVNSSNELLNSVRREILPFHHLTSAALLAPVSEVTSQQREIYQSRDSHSERRQLFWQSLAARRTSAKEAALLDDSVEYSFIRFYDHQLMQTDWQVLFYDELSGCSEIYLAEMFILKRRIYEAGDELRSVIELTETDLSSHLPETIFDQITSFEAEALFLAALSASYHLTLSSSVNDQKNNGGALDAVNGAGEGKKTAGGGSASSLSDYLNRHATEMSRRVESWTSSGNANEEGNQLYRLQLTNYWLHWQRAARLSGFDFDYLQTVKDASAVRFYELTKLWRVTPTHQPSDKLPKKMEIEYDNLCSLMPLPLMNTEHEIKWQISQLVKTLKAGGYLKSFTIKADWRGADSRRSKIIFQFGD